ncbi:MAG: hypothetical protein E6G44_05030 [Actinobacteria bacterium]|nr:MAG: hypothetical protein E6G44_05030 [Actinomycetota bacterium]
MGGVGLVLARMSPHPSHGVAYVDRRIDRVIPAQPRVDSWLRLLAGKARIDVEDGEAVSPGAVGLDLHVLLAPRPPQAAVDGHHGGERTLAWRNEDVRGHFRPVLERLVGNVVPVGLDGRRVAPSGDGGHGRQGGHEHDRGKDREGQEGADELHNDLRMTVVAQDTSSENCKPWPPTFLS